MLRAIWRHRFVFAATALLTMVLAFFAAEMRSPGYVATASLVVRTPATSNDGEPSSSNDPKRYIADQVVILGSRTVADHAVEILNADLAALSRGEDPDAVPTTSVPPEAGDEVEEPSGAEADAPVGTTTIPVRPASAAQPLRPYPAFTSDDIVAGLSVSNRVDANVIEVSFANADPVVASRAANAVVEAYEVVRRSQARDATLSAAAELEASIAVANAEINAVDERIDELRTSTPGRMALDDQYDRIVSQLASQATGSSSASDAATQSLMAQLQALRVVQEVERGRPEVSDLYTKRDQLVARRAALESRRDEVVLEAESVTTDIVFSSPAQVPEAPAGLPRSRFAVLGLLLGTIPAAVIAYLLATRRRSIDDATEPAQILGAPLLAEIPHFRHERTADLPVVTAPHTQAAEAFRFLATSVSRHRRSHSSTVFAVVSATMGDGKSVVAANLALAMANSTPLLAIDADLEGQGLTNLLCPPDGPVDTSIGLRQVIGRDVPLSEALITVEGVGTSELRLLSGGEHATAVRDLLESPMADNLFTMARADYGTVIIDLPPLLSMAYAASMLRWADGVVVVIPAGSPQRRVHELHHRLELVGVPVLGYVLNRSRLRGDRGSSVAARSDPGRRTNGLAPKARIPLARR